VVIALIIRWLVPLLTARIELDLQPYHVLLMSALVSFACPAILGFIVGLLLLDESDERTLQAMSVTPVSIGSYLAFKLTLPVVATTILTLVCIPIAGLIPFRFGYIAPVLLGALWAPLLALAMATFANNKLQGFVLMRASNVLIFIPMAAWFFDSNWQYAFAVLPSYWPLKAFWLASMGESYALVLVVGAIFHCALIAMLLRRFTFVIGRR